MCLDFNASTTEVLIKMTSKLIKQKKLKLCRWPCKAHNTKDSWNMTGHLSNSRMFTNKNSNRQINSENLVPLIFLKAKRKKKVFLQPSITLPIQILIDSDVSPVTIVSNEKKTINRNCLKMQKISWASIDFQV